MRLAVLWVLLVLTVQQALVSGHVLGRTSSGSDLVQLKSLLERLEETLVEAAQQEVDDGDYDMNQEPERNPEQEGNQESRVRSQAADEAQQSRALAQRNHLLDLLLTARKRTSGCFGARMDRVGNTSNLGCNSGRG